jgi:hypothetical protein
VFLIGGFNHDWIIFHFIYGIIPTPLTNSYFSKWLLHHQPGFFDAPCSIQEISGVHGRDAEIPPEHVLPGLFQATQATWGILPSNPLVNLQKAIENGPVEIVDLPTENGGSFQFVM